MTRSQDSWRGNTSSNAENPRGGSRLIALENEPEKEH